MITPEEFQRRLQEFADKVLALEHLEAEFEAFKRNLPGKLKTNTANAEAIINKLLWKGQSEIRTQQQALGAQQQALGTQQQALDGKRESLERYEAFLKSLQEQARVAADVLFREKSKGFPWLAKAFADYIALRDEQVVAYLEKKEHPALLAAEAVRTLKREKREIQGKYRVASYVLEYYEALFPWLADLRGEDLDDLIRVSPPVFWTVV